MSTRTTIHILATASMLALAACTKSEAQSGRSGAAGGAVTVGYVVAQAANAPIVQDLPGRVAAFQISDVRPQVSGVILRRLFKEGAIVHQGQTLYQIDPSLYHAAAAQASANLQSARASAQAANALATRYKPLAQMQAVAQQDYTTALSQARMANANIAQNAAALRTAQINVRFTSVPAPITGRVGLSAFTEGALVTSGQTNALTTITRLDPVFVDIQQSAADLLSLRRSLAQGGVQPTTAQVRLLLPDGTDYGVTGTVEFSQVIVDPNTGTVTLRASFPNPDNILLPGMFVKARFAQAIDTQAILVPEQALSRDPLGNATVWIVGRTNKAVQKTVIADRTQGANWVVTSGLQPGDKIITQGTGNLRPNETVQPVSASAPQRIQAPPGKSSQPNSRGS
jgi:membrane fusion protein (multidrug efflux system)